MSGPTDHGRPRVPGFEPPDEPTDLQIVLRPMGPMDVPLVTNSWMKNARKCYSFKGVEGPVYDRQQHRIIAKLIPKCVMVIAADASKPDKIYGWMCAEIIQNYLVVHYAWVRDGVKRRYEEGQELNKGQGVGTMMLQALLKQPNLRGLVYTHETQAGKYWLRHLFEKGILPWEPVYNPYQLYASFYGHQ